MNPSMTTGSNVLGALIAAQAEFTRNIRNGHDAALGPRFLLPREDLIALINPSDASAFGIVQNVAIHDGGQALVVCAVVMTNADAEHRREDCHDA